MVSVSQAICDELFKDQSIYTVFGIPGAYCVHLVDRLASEQQISYILTSHEAGAAFAAQVYGQVKRSFGVVITTAGPAATNCVTPLISAKGDGDSVLFIHGEVPEKNENQGNLQDFSNFGSSIKKIMKEVVYQQFELLSAADFAPASILHHLKQNRGAVELDIKSNVFSQAYCQSEPKIHEEIPSEDPSHMKSVLPLLMESKSPIICLVGHGVYRDNIEALDEFLRKTRLPVITTGRAVACVDHSLENYIGQYCIFPHQTVRNFFASLVEGDGILLCLGTSFSESGSSGIHELIKGKVKTIIHVNRCNFVKERLSRPKYPGFITRHLLCDLGHFFSTVKDLPSPISNLPGNLSPPRHAMPLSLKYDRFDELLGDNVTFLSGQRVAFQIGVALQSTQKIVNMVADTGSSKLYASHYISYKKNWRCIVNSGSIDCLGFGLSASIGAAFASRDMNENAVTIAMVGDGGLLMNNELNTVASDSMNNISLIIFVMNDSSLSYVHQGFAAVMGRPLKETRFSHPIDFKQMASAFGIYSEVVEDPNTINEAFLNRLIARQQPVVIDCRLVKSTIGPGFARYNTVRNLIGKKSLTATEMALTLVEPEVFNGGGPNRLHLYGIIYDVFRGCIDTTKINSETSGVVPELTFGLGVSSFKRDTADIGDAIYFNGRFFVRRTDGGEARNTDGSKYSEGTSADYLTSYSLGVTSLRDMTEKKVYSDEFCNGKKTMRDLLTDIVGPERKKGECGRVFGFVGIIDYEAFLGTSLSKSPIYGENILPIIDEYARPSIPTPNVCGLVCGFVRTAVEEWDDDYSHSLYERMFFDNPRDNDGSMELSVEMGTHWISHTHGVILESESAFEETNFDTLLKEESAREAWLEEIMKKKTFADCGHVIPSSILKKYLFITYPIHHVDVYNPPLQVGISTLN